MKKLRDSHIFDKEKHGHYVEPSWVSERLFDVERFTQTIYDPAAGWGTIVKTARKAGYRALGSDIIIRTRQPHIPKINFLHDHRASLERNRFSVVCNPPFDHVEEFCRRSIDIGARKVAMIFLLRRLPAAHWIRELPLKCIYLLTPRPSMPPGRWIRAGNKPGGGTQDFCWLVFDTFGSAGTPTIKWLHRDGE